MKAPAHWKKRGLIAQGLRPVSWLYQGLGALRHLMVRPYQASIPVICVGNITSGGTGKTPVTAYTAQLAKANGLRPVILSRGYGGTITAPCFVDPALHSAKDCGDEPLILAEIAPVVISANRAKGAAFIEAQDSFDVIIMDDGMQNPQLHKDKTICVFDGTIGVQNGMIFPAGPLRNTLEDGARQADIIIINGADKTDIGAQFPKHKVISAALAPQPPIPKIKQDKPLFAFAGIGRPERFFETLSDKGYYLVQQKAFGDHHLYDAADLKGLIASASALSAQLVTTQKDWVRLPTSLKKEIAYLPVLLHISSEDAATLAACLIAKGQ